MVPEYPLCVGAAVVFVGAGAGAADCVADALALADAVAVALEVAVAPAVGFPVAFDDGAAFVGAGVAPGFVTAPPEVPTPREPVRELDEVVDVNCGGVIAKTAPRPPTVPPAISNARFMGQLSPQFLRSIWAIAVSSLPIPTLSGKRRLHRGSGS